MTFNQALSVVNSKGKNFVDENLELLVLIAPKNLDDLVQFLINYDEKTYSYEDCIPYCSDYNYQLYLIKRML
jgi:hypothetical protein